MPDDIGLTTEICIASPDGKFALDAWEPVFKHSTGTDCWPA